MKPRDYIIAQVEHRETSPVPYTVSFEGDVQDRLDVHYGGRHWRDRIQVFLRDTHALDPMRKKPTDRPGYERDPYGSLWRMDRRPFHLEVPALPRPSLDGYRWPDVAEFLESEDQLAEARRFCAREREQHFVIAFLGWGLFETGWGLRGFEGFLSDVALEPAFVEALLDRITEQFLAYIDVTTRELPDVDAIMFGDDWGDQRGVIIGPERWRALFKPRYARIYDAAHRRGKVVISHCCGSIVDILPDVIDIGLDVLESVQPEARGMNPYELKKRWGRDLAFWGCLGSQSTIPFGTPGEIRDEVRRLRSVMGKGGGFILAPAKELQPGTPTENAVAVVEAFTTPD